jgi:hypothetical protein
MSPKSWVKTELGIFALLIDRERLWLARAILMRTMTISPLMELSQATRNRAQFTGSTERPGPGT